MNKVVQRLYTSSQVRELDRLAIRECGIDGYELMKRAGLAGYRLLRHCYPGARRLLVYCGSGNNGGDGYVVATLALKAGMKVKLVAVGDVKSETATRAREDFERTGGFAAVSEAKPAEGDVIVDALLGTGLARAPAGAYSRAIDDIALSGLPVVAMDVPSGLQADTGEALTPCVRAAATATFVGMKLGCVTGKGPELAGRLYFDSLGVPRDIYDSVEPTATVIDPEPHATRVASRPASFHKGDAGRVLILGGNHGMPGAPCMSALAAHRSGAGLVYLASRLKPEQLIPATPESMATEISSTGDLKPLLSRADVIAVGPGLGMDAWAKGIWEEAVSTKTPLIVDADALNLLAETPVRREDWILTPHPGEAARLLGTTVDEVQSDRVTAVKAMQKRYGGVIVLKGPGTLVLGQKLHVCDRGNPGMASGGTGDALTGIVAGFRGQGLSAEDAACYGVWCHAHAGDLAAGRSAVGMTASDLIDSLREVVGRKVA